MALSSTSVLAQEAQPTTTPPPASQPAPDVVSAQPAPALDPAPATTDEPAVAPADTVAPKHATAAKPKHVAPAQPTVTSSRTVARTQVAKAAVPVAAATPKPAPAPAAPAVKPIVSTNAPPARTAKPASAPAKPDSTALELGGGALAVLALGAGAFALTRRRRDDEEMMDDSYEPAAAEEPEVHHEPVVDPQPAMIAPELSAFSWGDRTHVDARREMGSDDRQAGETWVERAYRGPSPENPSLSLKKRLKRAAFFDKREQAVDAGTAEPVDPEAGLPEAAVEDMRETEFETA